MSTPIRCAIYTRKSSEEGLEQSFNSLHAQREACEAFIRSQMHEGWQAIPTAYDDGGFSGGNIERPGLKRLMADIETGKVNTVVVYKVDRLTRSLADFAKIIERFDSRQVSFVSVTQQFNTTSSMGRLTLNVLLSFAQFEREVTGERIRDKIAASKKRGIWMGGPIPLGYDLRERRLYINPEEADRIRAIYREYQRLGNVMNLKTWLDENRIMTKGRACGEGMRSEPVPFSRGALYRILRNHIYVGEISHKGAVFPGDHDAIVDRDEWDRVQKMLTENRQGNPRKARATKAGLLTGILSDEFGNIYTPTHTNKGGRRYRYYTSQAVIRKAVSTEVPARIPAHEIEKAVADRVYEFLRSPGQVLAAIAEFGEEGKAGKLTYLLEQATNVAQNWLAWSAGVREEFLKAVLERVVLHPESIELRVRLSALLQQNECKYDQSLDLAGRIVSIRSVFQHTRKGKSLRLMIAGATPEATPGAETLLRSIARARIWYEQFVAGEVTSLPELARLHGLSMSYVKRSFPLAFLAPGTVEALLRRECVPNPGRAGWSRNVPLDWDEQDLCIRGPFGL